MIAPRMYQVKYDASLRTVLSNFRFTLWGPAPHHSLKNRILFWLPARWASGFSGDHQQDHQCLWLLFCYSFILPFIACILLGIKLLLLLLLMRRCILSEWRPWACVDDEFHNYSNVTMGAMATEITSLTIIYSIVYSGAGQRKHQRFASLAFVGGIHRSPANCQ